MNKKKSFLIAFLLCAAAFSGGTLWADCAGCVESHVLGVDHVVYIKKCTLKRKRIEGAHCPHCHCLRAKHSIHKHPYKTYQDAQGRTRKLIPQRMQTISIKE